MDWLLTCGPLILTLLAWIALATTWRSKRPPTLAILALSFVTANAVLAAGGYLRARYGPSRPPPWQDPINLSLGLLVLLAPAGASVALAGIERQAPTWLVVLLLVASVPLFLLGLFAVMSV